VLDRNACGSSSGSAAGVAASLAQVAIGTETDGSIVCPSGTTGIVGVKPTLGLVSRAGVVPISAQQDTAGPMARNVVDAALTLAVIQGRDTRDAATADIPADQPRRYRLDRNALRGKRIGVWRLSGVDADVDKIVEQRVTDLHAAGATTVDVAIDDSVVFDDEFTALLAEFKRDVNAYLAATPGRHPADLAGLIAFNAADPVELRYFGQQIFLDAQASPPTTDPSIVAARTRATTTARHLIDDTLARYRLDAIVAPTNGPAWVSTLGKGDAFVGPSSSTPPAVSGYPSVTVPAGFDGALPIGMSFIGTRWSEPEVLSLAYAFEQLTHERRPPQYLPTTGS
jgi:amidase